MAERAAYEEMKGSPVETHEALFSAQRTLKCPWADRQNVRGQLLFGVYPFVTTPAANPARCVRIQVKPFPGGQMQPGSLRTTAPTYVDAILELFYEQSTVTIVPIPGWGLISERLDPVAEFITLPPDEFEWSDGTVRTGLKPEEAPGKLIRGWEWTLTRYQVSQLPATVEALIETVNDGSVVSPTLGRTFASETLLFHGPSVERNDLGSLDVTYRFTYRRNGWNKFWRASTQSWASMYLLNSTTPYKNFPAVSWVGKL